MCVRYRWFFALLIFFDFSPQFAVAQEAQFTGPSTVVYFVGTNYAFASDSSGPATYFFYWGNSDNVSAVTTSGSLPPGLTLAIAPLPVPFDAEALAIEGTPVVGSEGTYDFSLVATVDQVEYTYPVHLVIDDMSAAPATLSAGFTGNWFGGASQSGNGFSIEVLPNSILLAEWYVFAPNGGPTWIVGTGPIVGNTATVSAYQVVGAGGVFPPEFDTTQVKNQAWGTLNFVFYDCNDGYVSWIPTAAGYDSGSMPLQRLTMPAGLNCP